MNNPQVSIVVAAYNSENYIATALESACAQDLSAIEIVVVDDGSTDGTADIVQRFAARDGRIVFLRNEANLGPAGTRNRAISAARGAWVAPLDADDWYEPSRLTVLLADAERTGADLIADNLLVHDEASGRTYPAFQPWRSDPFGPVSAADMCRQDWPNTGPMGLGYAKPMIRRAFLVETGLRYADDVRIGEDFDLYVRCLMRGGRLFLLDRPLYHYTRRRGSLSKTDDSASYRDFTLVNHRLLEAARTRVPEDPDLVQALTERQLHLDSHLPFMEFRDAWQRRDVRQLFQSFRQIPSYRYAVSRLANAGFRRIMAHVRPNAGWRVPDSDGRQA